MYDKLLKEKQEIESVKEMENLTIKEKSPNDISELNLK